ncbi:hypothetical protein [Agromyces sp. SYSU T0242]|uniref:hypothetical protein n=1 Tax=Agromyces litoreus TaxID=3158561 RepID=UPI003395F487
MSTHQDSGPGTVDERGRVRTRSIVFRLAWGLLAASAFGMALSMVTLWVVVGAQGSELTLVTLIGLSLYGAAVLVSPYRRRLRWAWVLTWLLPIGFAAVGLLLPRREVGVWYLVVAAGLAIAQAVAWSGFRDGRSATVRADARSVSAARRIPFLAALAILTVVAAAGVLNAIVGYFFYAGDVGLAFLLFGATGVYAVTVLLTGYARAETWAWVATWILVGMLVAVSPFASSGAGPYYLGAGVLLAACQVAAVGRFAFARREQVAAAVVGAER